MLVVGLLDDVGKLLLFLVQLLVGSLKLSVGVLLIVHLFLGLVRVLLGDGQLVLSSGQSSVLGLDFVLQLVNLMTVDLELTLELRNLILAFNEIL